MEWLRTHRNKLIFASLTATGLYGVGWYLLRRVEQWRLAEPSIAIPNSRLSERAQSNHQTAVSAVMSVLPKLQELVYAQLDTEVITEQLKAKPANKVALWEELKSLSFARLVTSVYASSLLASFMSVQLSILGGLMLQGQHKTSDGGSSDSHKQYLSMVEHLFQEGVVTLCAGVRRAAEDVLAAYSLKQELTCEGLEQLIRDIQQSTCLGGERSRRCFLVQYSLPQESLLGQSECRSDLSAAVRDIVESPEFSEVLEGCLEIAFTLIAGSLTQSYHSASQSQTVLPLARVIPMVTDHTQLVFSSQQPNVVLSVLQQKNLFTLSQNIYESFSQE